MDVLVCGPGAEDARCPVWGSAVSAATALGHTVWPFDPAAAARSDRDGDPSPA
jgi:hypothetical protein